jgi:hypothetical protein
MNFGVSQSRAGEDVEKHRDSWKAAKGDDRPMESTSVQCAEDQEKFYRKHQEALQVGRRKAIWGPASIFI